MESNIHFSNSPEQRFPVLSNVLTSNGFSLIGVTERGAYQFQNTTRGITVNVYGGRHEVRIKVWSSIHDGVSFYLSTIACRKSVKVVSAAFKTSVN